jgi:hypothetical protein
LAINSSVVTFQALQFRRDKFSGLTIDTITSRVLKTNPGFGGPDHDRSGVPRAGRNRDRLEGRMMDWKTDCLLIASIACTGAAYVVYLGHVLFGWF